LRHKQWDPAFLEICKKFRKEQENKPVIFCGDLNVAHTADDLARPKENVGNKGFTDEEREGIQNMIDAGFVDTFRIFTKGNEHYSWWSHFANARAATSLSKKTKPQPTPGGKGGKRGKKKEEKEGIVCGRGRLR